MNKYTVRKIAASAVAIWYLVSLNFIMPSLVVPVLSEDGLLLEIVGCLVGLALPLFWTFFAAKKETVLMFTIGSIKPENAGNTGHMLGGIAVLSLAAAGFGSCFEYISYFTSGKVTENVMLSGGRIGMYLLDIAVLVPVCEELFYRVVIGNALCRTGRLFAVTASAMLFALAHSSLSSFVTAFLLGSVLMDCYLRFSNVLYVFILHSVYNIFQFVLSEYVEIPLSLSFSVKHMFSGQTKIGAFIILASLSLLLLVSAFTLFSKGGLFTKDPSEEKVKSNISDIVWMTLMCVIMFFGGFFISVRM